LGLVGPLQGTTVAASGVTNAGGDIHRADNGPVTEVVWQSCNGYRVNVTYGGSADFSSP